MAGMTVVGGQGPRPARGERERCDGDVQRQKIDRREDVEPVRVLVQSAWHTKSAAAMEEASQRVFPALSAQVQVRALVVEVALKLFGRKSAGVVRTRVRELVQFGDVKKETRDTTAEPLHG